MLKLIKTKYFFSLILLISFLIATPTLALNLKDSFSTSTNSGLTGFAANAGFANKTQTPEAYIGLVLTGLFSILGIIAIILIIYSGFTWMTARGNESQVTKAKENLFNVIIGLIFIIGGYALTVFLLKIFN
jgi:hypothetical protein